MTARDILRPNTVRLASDDRRFASEACRGYESYTADASSRSYDLNEIEALSPAVIAQRLPWVRECRTTAPTLKELQQGTKRFAPIAEQWHTQT